MILDTQRVETLMTILILSSAASMIMVFFVLWFLSRWAEVKELLLNLLKKIDENYVQQKSEKLKAIYVKQNFNEEATLNYEEPQTTEPKTTSEKITTTLEIQPPVFEEDTTTTTKAPVTTKDIKELIKKKQKTHN